MTTRTCALAELLHDLSEALERYLGLIEAFDPDERDDDCIDEYAEVVELLRRIEAASGGPEAAAPDEVR